MKLYNINELKDSRIFFDKKPPIFLTIFIGILILILILSFYFSKIFLKPYIVKAQGVVTTSDNQLISSQYNGEIISISAEEGQKVAKGDVLFTLSNGQEGLQNSALIEQVQNLRDKQEVMKRYEESLNKKENYMKNSGLEQEYYGKVEYYLLQVKTENFDKGNLGTQLNEKKRKKESLEKELNSLSNELDTIQKDKTKISNEVRAVQENTTESNAQEENINEEKNSADSSLEEMNLKESEIQGKIEAKKSEIEGIKEEINQIEQQKNNPSSPSKDTYNQLMSELGVARYELQSKIVELEGQISINTGQESSLIVKSNNDGIVHYLVPVQVGMSIQANQVIGEVSHNLEDDLQVEAYIDARDITKVTIGQKVHIAIDGVNTYKFGTLEGKLLFVDSGTLTQETSEGNKLFYRCLVGVARKTLHANDGTGVKLIKSMPVEARIVYEEETYYEWMVKMLNFRN